jgi:hypothetical protein
MRARLRRAMFYALATALGLAGCSVLVPSEVPDFHCTAGGALSCPSGLVCDATLLVCVAPSNADAGDDVVSDEDASDASTDRDPTTGPSPLGGDCVVDGDCETGLLCGTSTLLTTAIVPVNSQPICTKPCCSTTECAAGFVCFSGATGGNYCVSAEKADRTPPTAGGKSAGQSCSVGTECRSGLCAGRCQNAPGVACDKASDCQSGGCSGTRRCVDTCCGANECASGSTCRILTVDTHVVWSCGAPNSGSGAKDLDASCTATTDCKNDNCVGFPQKRCTPPCCRTSDCTALGFTNFVCAYGQNGNDRIKWCFEPTGGADAPLGATCTADFDCTSRYCDGELRKCLNVCCTDDDCAKDESCRPSPVGTPLLRCVKDR